MTSILLAAAIVSSPLSFDAADAGKASWAVKLSATKGGILLGETFLVFEGKTSGKGTLSENVVTHGPYEAVFSMHRESDPARLEVGGKTYQLSLAIDADPSFRWQGPVAWELEQTSSSAPWAHVVNTLAGSWSWESEELPIKAVIREEDRTTEAGITIPAFTDSVAIRVQLDHQIGESAEWIVNGSLVRYPGIGPLMLDNRAFEVHVQLAQSIQIVPEAGARALMLLGLWGVARFRRRT